MRPGERLAGRFEIIGVAGRGGMGTVFRARDRRTDRDVAVKIMQPEAMRGVARFEQEAALLSALRHPHIVQYVAHGASSDDVRYLVMAWVPGESLARRLDRDDLDPAAAVAIAAQLAGALEALHARAIVHRDVKPSNVMLSADGAPHATLVDFGVARRNDGAVRLTDTGAMVGTAGYMAPEQVRGERGAIDGRADLFALGAVLYECLTGQAAFVGETRLGTRAKMLVHEPTPLRVLEPSLPAALDALVSSLLARDPASRPADAGAVVRALAAIGPLPTRRDRTRAMAADAPTVASPRAIRAAACALILAWHDAVDDERAEDARERAVEELIGGGVEAIAGGLVIALPDDVVAAARLALRITARFPRALIAIGAGASLAAALDRSARVIEDLEVDAAAGVWVSPDAAAALRAGFELTGAGDRVRVESAR